MTLNRNYRKQRVQSSILKFMLYAKLHIVNHQLYKVFRSFCACDTGFIMCYVCRSNRCCFYTPYSFGTLWLTIEITTSNHYQERMTVPDITGLQLGLLEMGHFLLILVNKIRLILRSTQISIGISNIKTSKYSLKLTHSKPIPTFPLAFQIAVSNICTNFVLSFQINVVCLLGLLFFSYHCENKPWLFPKETFNGFVFIMENDRTFCEVGTIRITSFEKGKC
jgi:hypothetical protein